VCNDLIDLAHAHDAEDERRDSNTQDAIAG